MRWLAPFLLSTIAALAFTHGNQPATTPMRTADFVAMIGVNTHLDFTDGGYANLANVVTDMQYLGLSVMRDKIQGAGVPSFYYSVAAAVPGKYNFVTAGGAWTTSSLATQFGMYDTVWTNTPGSVESIEGPNEINNEPMTFNSVGGLAGAVAMQQQLVIDTAADAHFPMAPVYYFTGYAFVSGAPGPDPRTTSGLANYDNDHPYPNRDSPPAPFIYPYLYVGQLLNNSEAPMPFVYTEAGYNSVLANGGTNEDVQAKWTLSLLMDAAKFGAHRVFLYELMDAYNPPTGWGLFDSWIGSSNTPKPAGTAIHNLTTIIADTGGTARTFTPTALVYGPQVIVSLPASTIVPNPPNAPHTNVPPNTLLMQKSTGTYELAVWNEPLLWNSGTDMEITVSPINVPLSFKTFMTTVNVYDPMVGTTPTNTYHGVTSMTLSLTDHPLIVELIP